MAQQQYGMFGPMPDEIRQMQQLQAEKQAMNVAQLSSGAQGIYQSSLAGRAIGNGISQVFGGEDPAVKRANQLQAISKEVQQSGIDPNNFEDFYTKLGTKLAEAGMMSEAASVAQALQSYKDKQYDLETKRETANVAKMRAEAFKRNKITPANEHIWKNIKEYDQQSFAKWADSAFKDEERGIGDLSLLKPAKGEGGFKDLDTTDKGYIIFDDKTANPMVRIDGQLVPYNPAIHGKAGGKAPKTNVDVRVGGPQVKVENIREAEKPGMSDTGAQLLGKMGGDAAVAHSKALTAIRSLEPTFRVTEAIAKKGNIITGSFADQRLSLDRLGGTLAKSLGIDYDMSKVNDTDFLNTYTNRAILPMLAAIGGNDSNEEMERMRQAVANNTMTPEMILNALRVAKMEAERVKDTNKKFTAGLNRGENNPEAFWANGGEWPSQEIKYKKDAPENKTKTEFKGGEEPVREAAARGAVQVNPPPSKINTLMQKYPGMTEAEARVVLQGKK